MKVVWGKEPSPTSTDTYYLPRSTCTEGRNYLLQLAYAKGLLQVCCSVSQRVAVCRNYLLQLVYAK